MNKLSLGVLLAAFGLTSVAYAGWRITPEVSVSSFTDGDGDTFSSASGGLLAAANSSDNKQYITCTTYRLVEGTFPATGYGFCVATDKDFNSASCITHDARHLDIILSMNEATQFGFSAVNGTCESVWVATGSQNL